MLLYQIKISRKSILLSALLSACICTQLSWAQNIPSAKPESVGMSSKKLEHMTKMFQAEVDKGAIPGAIIQRAAHQRLDFQNLLYDQAFGFGCCYAVG